MMSIGWAKPVATELLIIRMSRPFAAKPGAGMACIFCNSPGCLHDGFFERSIKVNNDFYCQKFGLTKVAPIMTRQRLYGRDTSNKKLFSTLNFEVLRHP